MGAPEYAGKHWGIRGYQRLPHRKALQLFSEHQGQIDILLPDVVMSIMSGKQLKEKIITLHPDLKTLFLSGYTANAIEQHGVLTPGVHYIQKPFTLVEISNKIIATLGP